MAQVTTPLTSAEKVVTLPISGFLARLLTSNMLTQLNGNSEETGRIFIIAESCPFGTLL